MYRFVSAFMYMNFCQTSVVASEMLLQLKDNSKASRRWQTRTFFGSDDRD